MKILEVPRISSTDFKADTGYYIKETNDPAFFPGRAATIYYRAPPKKSPLTNIKTSIQVAFRARDDIEIGTLGILHPSVLEKFEIGYPCSAVEFTLEPFKKEMQKT
jgi:phenylalanyl-tRNA synthetase beta chain